jgi:cytochrome c-type biogenesis protein CcmH
VDRLISGARDDAEWLPMIKNALAQVDEKARPLNAQPSSAPGARPEHSGDTIGPDESHVAAAAQIAPTKRKSMIENMVARLAQHMAEDGSDVDGWLRLIRSYSVLGKRNEALRAATNASTALSGNNDCLHRIDKLTKELGLEGA